MTRQLFVAADIRRLAHEQKSDLLVLGPFDILTPEAADLAKQLGVRVVRESPPAAPPSAADKAIRAIRSLPALKAVRASSVSLEPFGASAPARLDVRLKDVVTSADGSPMAAGYMSLGAGAFPWTLNYDEIDVVLEGVLEITRGDSRVSAGPGDVIFIPKGSSITFGSPAGVKFIYIAYPADWANQ